MFNIVASKSTQPNLYSDLCCCPHHCLQSCVYVAVQGVVPAFRAACQILAYHVKPVNERIQQYEAQANFPPSADAC